MSEGKVLAVVTCCGKVTWEFVHHYSSTHFFSKRYNSWKFLSMDKIIYFHKFVSLP